MQAGEVHLRHRRGGDRRGVEFRKHLGQRFSVGRLERGDGLGGWERRHPVLQPGKFVGDVERDQVTAGGEHLPELDEDRTQRLQRAPQAYPARLGKRPPEQGGAHQPAQRLDPLVAEEELLQPVTQADGEDAEEAQQLHASRFSSCLKRASRRATSSARMSTSRLKRATSTLRASISASSTTYSLALRTSAETVRAMPARASRPIIFSLCAAMSPISGARSASTSQFNCLNTRSSVASSAGSPLYSASRSASRPKNGRRATSAGVGRMTASGTSTTASEKQPSLAMRKSNCLSARSKRTLAPACWTSASAVPGDCRSRRLRLRSIRLSAIKP